jgi:hypothetical protein
MIGLVVIEPPLLIVSVPFTVGEVFTVKAPLNVKSLNVVALPPSVPDPTNAMVPVPLSKVPLFVNDPVFAIVMVLLPRLTVELDDIVKFKMVGEVFKFTVTPVGIVATSELMSGTPPHQFPAVFQSPEEPPIQVPVAFTVVVIADDVAGEPVAHVAVDVITTVTASLFAKLDVM